MKLTTAARKKIQTKDFAGPGRSYPIEDKGHAIAAESDATKFASPSLAATVRKRVKAKYPGLGKVRGR